MELQIALDRLPLDRAVALAALVAPHADWIEVGTSLIKRYGVAAIRAVVDAAGPVPVLADTKTADDASTEFEMCFEAGARAVTVLGLTSDATVRAAVAITAGREAELVVDLLSVRPPRRADLLASIGPAPHVLWAPHVGKDAQQEDQEARGTAVRVTGELGPWARGLRTALGGGLRTADLAALAPAWPHLRAIVGGAVTSAPDPLAAVIELRAATERPPEGTP
ncbi:hypothetical protein GBF35_26640 [Nonomuraea phyllanthi]|uniref:orotidine 5'-phosphate decarboxylase / HUMPS family protein n=1 Tax=Nonomuraea phyllanthi TaxID=2219224 RepID=UPI00129339A7|nr:orotidine 5'-phosphate decarboxylase / HUMPS family protein [Nonomuraea phyllanthi]QFY09749.1 hypothetical protein GBF35_26640 [Nonomuraea phyllanthi]